MNKKEYLDYIIDYAESAGWEDFHGKDQIRALFTSWCLIFRIDVDTEECDTALKKLYYDGELKELVDWNDYERFMIEFIV